MHVVTQNKKTCVCVGEGGGGGAHGWRGRRVQTVASGMESPNARVLHLLLVPGHIRSSKDKRFHLNVQGI